MLQGLKVSGWSEWVVSPWASMHRHNDGWSETAVST
jgi:hypothetical protein